MADSERRASACLEAAPTIFAASCRAWASANCAVGGASLPSNALTAAAQSPAAQRPATPDTERSAFTTRRPRLFAQGSSSMRGLGCVPMVHTTVPPSIISPESRCTARSVTSAALAHFAKRKGAERGRELRQQPVAAVQQDNAQVLAANAAVVAQAREQEIDEFACGFHSANESPAPRYRCTSPAPCTLGCSGSSADAAR